MLTEEDVEQAIDKVKKILKANLSFDDITVWEDMTWTRQVAVVLALMGEFDEQVEKVLNERSDTDEPGNEAAN